MSEGIGTLGPDILCTVESNSWLYVLECNEVGRCRFRSLVNGMVGAWREKREEARADGEQHVGALEFLIRMLAETVDREIRR